MVALAPGPVHLLQVSQPTGSERRLEVGQPTGAGAERRLAESAVVPTSLATDERRMAEAAVVPAGLATPDGMDHDAQLSGRLHRGLARRVVDAVGEQHHRLHLLTPLRRRSAERRLGL